MAPSACRIANIAFNDAMILSYDANPGPDGIFGRDRLKHSAPPDAAIIYEFEAAVVIARAMSKFAAVYAEAPRPGRATDSYKSCNDSVSRRQSSPDGIFGKDN